MKVGVLAFLNLSSFLVKLDFVFIRRYIQVNILNYSNGCAVADVPDFRYNDRGFESQTCNNEFSYVKNVCAQQSALQ